MWLHRNTNTKYPAFNQNVERWWVEWPMWIAAGQFNSKGYQATQSVIMPDNGRNRLWTSTTNTGQYAESCDFDDYGYSYFCGSLGTIKRDIMTDTQIWATSSGSTETIIRTNSDYLYIGTANTTKKLRKLDLNGNLVWEKSHTASFFRGIDFDSLGNIYAIGGDYIEKYNPDGTNVFSILETSTGAEFYDIKIYGSNIYCAVAYGATSAKWSNNGAIKVYDLDGNAVKRFGAELLNRDATSPYYQAIEVDANFVYAISNESGQGLDIYGRTSYGLTFSAYTDTLLSGVYRIQDLEINESGNLVMSDFTGGNIYQLSSTFSYVRNWETGYTGVKGIRFKKTY
jgi:hypothetical protein